MSGSALLVVIVVADGLLCACSPSQRFFMYAKLTENALETLAQPTDPLDMTNVNISVMGSASAVPEPRPSASPQQTVSTLLMRIRDGVLIRCLVM